MTFVSLIILCLAFLTLSFGWLILRLGRQPREFLKGKLDVEFSGAHPPIARAFSRTDLDYLLSFDHSDSRMIGKFRDARRRIMSAFLRDSRRDFYRAWSVCRQLAPMSDDPDFVIKLCRQFLTFHILYLRIYFQCFIGRYGVVDLDVEALAELLGRLRVTAGNLVRISQQPMASVYRA